MKIDQEKCIACGKCLPYCPIGVIWLKDKAAIDYDECVECGVCLDSADCPTGAIYQDELEWPRTLRRQFSNPKAGHTSTGTTGRGTEEMKSNDVTGRFKPGMFGLGIELGRPATGTRLYNIEKAAMAMAEFVDEFERENPVTAIIDSKTGKLIDGIANEKVLSAIVEFAAPIKYLPNALSKLRKLSEEVDTVFSVSLISVLNENNQQPVVKIAEECGFVIASRSKTNLGLGRIPQKGDNEHVAQSTQTGE